MAISNRDLELSTPVTDKDSYIKMRQALDSLTCVALTEFDLSVPEQFNDPDFKLRAKDAKRKKVFETDKSSDEDRAALSAATRSQIAGIVTNGVKKMLGEISAARSHIWIAAADDRAADFAVHARLLSDDGFRAVSELSQTDLDERVTAQIVARVSDGEDHQSCPPGFMEVDGICVPI